MSSQITINCSDEELKMFYMLLTVEPQEKITLFAPENVSIRPGEKISVDMKITLDSDEPILIYPNSILNDGPAITPNFCNIYNKDTKLYILHNPIIKTYKDLVNSGIEAFKADFLKKFIKKRENDELIDKIINDVPSYDIAKGSPLFDVYNFGLKPINVVLK